MTRALAGLGVLVIALALLVFPPRLSLASWTDAGYHQGAFSAAIPRPTITGCTSRNVVLVGGEVVITWTYPTGISATPTPSPIYWFSATSVATLAQIPASSVTTTGPIAGVYTTKYGESFFTSLLGNNAYVGISTAQGTWGSLPASATAAIPAVVGTGTCTIN